MYRPQHATLPQRRVFGLGIQRRLKCLLILSGMMEGAWWWLCQCQSLIWPNLQSVRPYCTLTFPKKDQGCQRKYNSSQASDLHQYELPKLVSKSAISSSHDSLFDLRRVKSAGLLRRFWRTYIRALDQNPILVKSATSFCGFLIGDLIAQVWTYPCHLQIECVHRYTALWKY